MFYIKDPKKMKLHNFFKVMFGINLVTILGAIAVDIMDKEASKTLYPFSPALNQILGIYNLEIIFMIAIWILTLVTLIGFSKLSENSWLSAIALGGLRALYAIVFIIIYASLKILNSKTIGTLVVQSAWGLWILFYYWRRYYLFHKESSDRAVEEAVEPLPAGNPRGAQQLDTILDEISNSLGETAYPLGNQEDRKKELITWTEEVTGEGFSAKDRLEDCAARYANGLSNGQESYEKIKTLVSTFTAYADGAERKTHTLAILYELIDLEPIVPDIASPSNKNDELSIRIDDISQDKDLVLNRTLDMPNETIIAPNGLGEEKEPQKLFCRKCGMQLPNDSEFCHKCGTAVFKGISKCPTCGREQIEGSEYCRFCGSKLS